MWLSRTPDWEPLIVFFGFLSTYLIQELTIQKKIKFRDIIYQHDKNLFQRYNDILAENEFSFIIDELYNNYIHRLYLEKISDYLELTKITEGKFNDKKKNTDFNNFVEKLFDLRLFISQHFFVNDTHNPDHLQWIHKLYPELKDSPEDEQRIIYFEREKELQAIVDISIEKFNEFRKNIKKSLHL